MKTATMLALAGLGVGLAALVAGASKKGGKEYSKETAGGVRRGPHKTRTGKTFASVVEPIGEIVVDYYVSDPALNKAVKQASKKATVETFSTDTYDADAQL